MRQRIGALEADRSVRRVYREVLRVAAALGPGWLPAETPDEYARRLGATVASESAAGGAEAARDLSALTAAYDRARYGETEPEGEQQREVRAQSERLVARLRGRLLLGQRSAATIATDERKQMRRAYLYVRKTLRQQPAVETAPGGPVAANSAQRGLGVERAEQCPADRHSLA